MKANITINPPKKVENTYDIEFTGLTLDEVLFIRASLSDSRYFREGSRTYKYSYLYGELDAAIPNLFENMSAKYEKAFNAAVNASDDDISDEE